MTDDLARRLVLVLREQYQQMSEALDDAINSTEGDIMVTLMYPRDIYGALTGEMDDVLRAMNGELFGTDYYFNDNEEDDDDED